MNIDLTTLSKEALLQIWREANKEKLPNELNINLSNKERIDKYLDYLKDNDFGSEKKNDLAYEIYADILRMFRYGHTIYDQDTDKEEVIKISNDTPLKTIIEYSINSIKGDSTLLSEYGLKNEKQINEFDWSIYDVQEFN